jgi:DtxR family transcriptional regulator, Mn-dependent transcriptional regulator
MAVRKSPGLGESLEDYVEIILALERDAGTARVRDIAERFGVSQPSVTGALRALKAKGLVRHEPYAHVTLTPAGRRVAGEVERRHRVLKEFLTEVLALPDAEADAAACRMEHVLAPAVVDRFCALAAFVHASPDRAAEWLSGIGSPSPRGVEGKSVGSGDRRTRTARGRSHASAAVPPPEGSSSC